MDNREYHFYDLEEKQTEGRSLLDNDLRDHTPSTHNYLLAVIAGVLGVLLVIASFVIGWIIFSRWTGSSINLSHAIMCTLALLFGAFATFFAFSLWRNPESAISRNANMAFIVYVGSLIFAIYFIVAALYLWIQQQLFNNLQKCQFTHTPTWESNFWGHTLEDSQLLFWRLYLVLVIFAVLIAVAFAILAWAAWTVLTNKVQSKKITLGIALIAIVVFGFLVVIWFMNDRATFWNIQSKLPSSYAYLPFIAFIFAIIALGLAFLNAVGNFIPAKTLNFIFAVLWVGFFLVFAIFVALLFRTVYAQSKGKGYGSQEASNFISERHYTEYCPSKYLTGDQYCGGGYATLAWESGVAKEAQLNPLCDCSSTDLLFWPYFCLAIFSAFLLASVGVAAVSNFGLASSEHDDETYKSFHIFNVIAIALILLLGLALGLWLIFRPAGVNNLYQLPNSGLNTGFRGELTPNSSFGGVPQATSQNVDLKDQCYFLGKTALPVFPKNDQSNIGYSVGVLVTNGKINSEHLGQKAKLGPRISRQYFFENALNSNDDFVNLYGDADAVSEGLRNLVVCQSSLQLYHGVYVSAIKADLNKVSEHSLTGGANPSYTEPYPSGSFANLSGFTSPVGVCGDTCSYEVVKPSNGYLNIRGTLLIKNAAGEVKNYGVPESSVELNFYQNEYGKEAYLAVGSYDANGNFVVQAPYIQNAAYKGVLKITDKDNQYQSTSYDVLVNPQNSNSDLNVGSIQLTTKTGVGCKQQSLQLTNQCFAQQNAQSGNANLKVSLHDLVNAGEDLEYPLTLTLRRGFSELSPVVLTETLNGPTWNKDLPVGYYLVTINGNGYGDNSQGVTLDSDKTADLYLEQKVQGGYRIYAAIDNTIDPTADYDLNLKIRSADGKECVVSPSNRVCPFATHIQSVSNNQKGFEVIELSQFTNSYYMVYITRNPNLSNNCPYANTVSKRFLARKDNHLIDYLANPAVRIYTTLSSIFSSGGSGMFGGGSSYTAHNDELLNPIKYGERSIIPNLFHAMNQQGYAPPANDLFGLYVDNSDDASVFGASMPLLYPENSLNSQINLVQNSNFPSTYTSNFNSWASSGNQQSAQEYVVASVFGNINGVNENKNELIREQNTLNSGFNWYNLFDNNSYNSVGGFMTNFPGWDSQSHGNLLNSWTANNSNLVGENKINLNANTNAQTQTNYGLNNASSNQYVQQVSVQPQPAVVVQPEPVVVVQPEPEVVVQPQPVVVVQPEPEVVVQPEPVVVVQPEPEVVIQPVVQNVVQNQQNMPPVESTGQTVNIQPVLVEQQNVITQNSEPINYTGSVQKGPVYTYPVDLGQDGTYPLETDLLPETTQTSTQTTVVNVQNQSPVVETQQQTVEVVQNNEPNLVDQTQVETNYEPVLEDQNQNEVNNQPNQQAQPVVELVQPEPTPVENNISVSDVLIPAAATTAAVVSTQVITSDDQSAPEVPGLPPVQTEVTNVLTNQTLSSGNVKGSIESLLPSDIVGTSSIVVAQNNQLDYTNSVKLGPVYTYTVNLKEDGTYPLDTKLIPENGSASSEVQQTVQSTGTHSFPSQSVEVQGPIYPTALPIANGVYVERNQDDYAPVVQNVVPVVNTYQEPVQQVVQIEDPIQNNYGTPVVLTPVVNTVQETVELSPEEAAAVNKVQTVEPQVEIVTDVPSDENSASNTSSSTWTTIVNAPATVANSVSSASSTAWNNVVDAETKAADYVKDASSSAYNTVVNAPANIASASSTAWNNVVDAETKAADYVKDTSSTAWNNVVNAETNAVDYVKDASSSAYNTVANAPANIATASSNAWNTVVDAETKAADYVKDASSSAYNTVVNAPTNVASAVSGASTTAWNNVVDAETKAADYVKDTSSSAWNTVVDAETKAADYVKDTSSSAYNTVVNAPANIASASSTAWNNVVDAETKAVDYMKDASSSAYNTVASAPTNVASAVSGASTTAWNNVVDAETKAADYVKDASSSAWNNVVDAETKAADYVKDASSSAYNTVVNAPTNVASAVSGASTNAWNTVVDAETKAADYVKDASSSAWNNVVNAETNAVDYMKDASSSAYDTVANAPTNVANAVTDASSSAWTTITNAPSNLANAVSDTASTVGEVTSDAVNTAGDVIVSDRRLKKGRLLQALTKTYTTQFCFTGFGERSIKQYTSTGSGIPDIQPCVNLYPDNDSYSLKNLKVNVI